MLAALFAAFASAEEPSLAKFRSEIQPVLDKYCFECHGNGVGRGGVTLDEFETSAALHDPQLWLRALKNIRAGIMPPASQTPLPASDAAKIMQWIKRDGFGIDPAKPDPGRVTVRRLNRVEYRNTVRDLTGVDIDTQKEFPADDTGHGFDNIADVLTLSPLLLEKYLDAAQNVIAKAVVAKPRIVAERSILGRQFATVRVDTTLPEAAKPAAAPAPANAPPSRALAAGAPPAVGQPPPLPGRGPRPPPPATRPAPTVEGDTVVLSYYTPAVVAAKHRVEQAGKYQLVFDLIAHETFADDLFDVNKCKVMVSVDGQKLLDQEFVREGYGKKFEYTFERELTAGEHEISVEMKPIGPETPQYRKLRIRINSVVVRGPMAAKFWAKAPGYDKYFLRDVPAGAAERRAYARVILEKFASRAFRRPVDPVTLKKLVALAEKVYSQPVSTFESGVMQSMVAVLASPSFIFREDRVEPLKPGQAHPLIDEYTLASRLSYFFWSSMPDEELLKLAAAGRLRANLPAQLTRMLADARSQELVRNFTGQWLQARDIATVPITTEDVFLRDHPDAAYEEAREIVRRILPIPREQRTAEDAAAFPAAFAIANEFNRRPKPQLTDALRRAMQQETEMTFGHILKEDRSFLELLESDYTFLNEVLAKHYGIAEVTGPEMRKVTLAPDSPRGGVLTQGTVLAVTSNPTRTSPVKRGVLILGAILGTPPAPPPPNIPALEDAATAAELRTMSLRDTLALHAKNPVCHSCHSRMDPLGLALENFNAMGAWRTTDSGQPVQPAGKLITGESFTNVREFKHILATSRRQDFYYALSEKLLTYALGRGVEYYDTPTLDELVAQLEASGGRPSALLHAIVNSAPFQQRRLAPASP
ncbi:MAG: DUF1592 domain-containing protein [Steroidobacteraceae bacterium]